MIVSWIELVSLSISGGALYMLYSVEEIDSTHELYESTVALRQTELYPVGRVTRSYILDEQEDGSTLLVVLKNRHLLGCARLFMDGDVAKISHIVVEGNSRFIGVGSSLMNRLVELAKVNGAKKVQLISPTEGIPFFKRFGFSPIGGEKKLDLLDLTAQDMELRL